MILYSIKPDTYFGHHKNDFCVAGCVIEKNVAYYGKNIAFMWFENYADCAKHSLFTDGALFWTFFNRRCYLKTSKSWRQALNGYVSGNSECGNYVP